MHLQRYENRLKNQIFATESVVVRPISRYKTSYRTLKYLEKPQRVRRTRKKKVQIQSTATQVKPIRRSIDLYISYLFLSRFNMKSKSSFKKNKSKVTLCHTCKGIIKYKIPYTDLCVIYLSRLCNTNSSTH